MNNPITLQFDRDVTISVGQSCKDMNWKRMATRWSWLVNRCNDVFRGTETLAEYFKMPKIQQDALKDVGGFVGGSLNGVRRKASAVAGRDIITLDFDNIPHYKTAEIIQTCRRLGVAECIYSTRKHADATGPRLRVLLPLSRTVSAEEYEPIARWIADRIGIQMADPTTFQCERLMYWPSCCADSEFVFEYQDAPMLDADAVLESYTDWRDFTAWPQVPGAVSYQKLAAKQGDPCGKSGVVGVFNRVYDIFSAMESYLPGIYEPVDTDDNRYTYLGGSTAGGAVIYDNGKFLYSHHATDPCSGKLVNAFDLVRLHRFGELDDAAKDGTPNNRLPSFVAMCELATADPKVTALMAKERQEQAVKDFGGVAEAAGQESADWMLQLDCNKETGAIKATISNVRLILDNDNILKGKIARNEFSGRIEVLGALPWSDKKKRRAWCDTDSNGLYWYMQKAYKIKSRSDIDSALDLHADQHSFNDVQEYIKGLEWDGTARLDTLFVDYLGAEDNSYTRAVCRKAFTAAVSRAMMPGCKYDNMLILCGPQGIGKSTLLEKMSRGWFNDSIRTFEGKEASELLPGVWLVEIAELDAFRRTDVSRIKQFLSLTTDRYRAAYGRHMSEFPRRCVFFGTCNQTDFLQDTTGNRRFWPVDVGIRQRAKNVWTELPNEVDQIWAEAKTRWQMGEPLYLTGEVEQMAQERQEQHRETSPQEGRILDFIEMPIPADWSAWSIDRRRDFWAGTVAGKLVLVQRTRVCAQEIWAELYGFNPNNMQKKDAKEINEILARLPGWERRNTDFRPYGKTRGFIRK